MSDTSLTTDVQLGGRYRIVREIARGGMATVYQAFDEVLERDVAVKVLHANLSADATFLDRFLREARAAAALTHPNVVSVFDWGEDGDDAYLVMEYVDGPSLREVLRARGRLEPEEATALLAAAAAGVGAAHRREVVHRDVKPENILVGADGLVQVTDFGLARAAAATTRTFEPGSLVGSPHYLAPEAVRDEDTGPAADVYALGVVLYECLVGRPPFEGDTAVATAWRHTADVVPAPSRTEGVAPDLDYIVTRATAPAPEDRYADASAFAAALRGAVSTHGAAQPGSGPGTLVIPPDATETLVPTPRSEADAPPPPAARASGSRTPRKRPDDTTHAASPADGEGQPEASVSRGARRGRRGRRAGRWLVIAAALLVALAGGLALAWATVIAPVADVPSVVDLPEERAVAELSDAGFEPIVADAREASTRVAEGHVVSQDPSGSARVGSEVTIVVSSGPPPVEDGVPDVSGDPEEAALAALRDVGLEAEVERRFHPEVEEGLVVATEPDAGTAILHGETVILVVSRGPEPIEVPGVVGESQQDALAVLADAGLEGAIATEAFDERVPAGVVLDQHPAQGATLHRGDRVELTVSKGPQGFEMPDVRNMKRKEAVEALRERGLEVRVEETDRGAAFWREKDAVASQEPRPGTTVYRGETVIIYVWK